MNWVRGCTSSPWPPLETGRPVKLHCIYTLNSNNDQRRHFLLRLQYFVASSLFRPRCLGSVLQGPPRSLRSNPANPSRLIVIFAATCDRPRVLTPRTPPVGTASYSSQSRKVQKLVSTANGTAESWPTVRNFSSDLQSLRVKP